MPYMQDVTQIEPVPYPTQAAAQGAAGRESAQLVRAPLDSAGGEAELPAWDLADLFAGPDDPALAAALDQATADARAFQAKYAGTLAGASGDSLAEAISAYERVEEVLGRVMSYGSLVFAGDALKPENGRFYQTLQERPSGH